MTTVNPGPTPALEFIEFKVKFITPLLIHGVERNADEAGLTGKALRGCWRFWFRAIVGGLLADGDFDQNTIFSLESEIFGAADPNIGAKFKLLVKPIGNLQAQWIPLGFSQRNRNREEVEVKGYPKGTEFKIKIIPRKNFEEDEKKVLLATIYLWAHLGAIGQRARRGFGSPVIQLLDGENPFDAVGLTIKGEFTDARDLRKHLKDGLIQVARTIKCWMKKKNKKVLDGIENNNLPQGAQYFILRSLRQVLVSEKPYSDLQAAIRAIHGSSQCKSLGWVEGGRGSRMRMASPVFTRLHKVNNGLLPVVTWCKQNVEITIPDNLCLRAYLKGGDCRHGVQFPDIGVKQNLLGENI